MKYKRIAALMTVACMIFPLAGCSGDTTPDSAGSGSASIAHDAPTMEQIYAVNTLEEYEKDGLQPSFSTCLREGEENKETNSLLTLYFDDMLGLVTRVQRGNSNNYQYFFQQNGTNFSYEIDEDKSPVLTILADDPEQGASETTYAETVFKRYSFGELSAKETLDSCTDNGETYHIVTDISSSSFKDNSGCTYIYAKQEYDVEKDTLRILDTFRTYSFTDSNGTKKKCTLSRCMTYTPQSPEIGDSITKNIKDAEWLRTITLETAYGKKEISVPEDIPVLVKAPDGYEAYTDRNFTKQYLIDLKEDGKYPDRKIYIVK